MVGSGCVLKKHFTKCFLMDALGLFVNMIRIKEKVLRLRALFGFAFLQQKEESVCFNLLLCYKWVMVGKVS